MADKEHDPKQKYMTPRGELMYPWLAKKDTRFDKEGKYKVDLALDPLDNEEHQEFLAGLKEAAEEHGGKQAKYGVKQEWDKNADQPTGRWIVSFSSGYQPKVFDATGQPIAPEHVEALKIGNGTVAKIAFTKNFYEVSGKLGVKNYLQAVQVLELVSYDGGSAGSFGFGEEDGFRAPEPPPAEDPLPVADMMGDADEVPPELDDARADEADDNVPF